MQQIYTKIKIHKHKNNYKHSEKECRDKLMWCKINHLVRVSTYHSLIQSKEGDPFNNHNKGSNLRLCKLIQLNHLSSNSSRLKYPKTYGVHLFHNFKRINSKWFNSLNFNNHSFNNKLYFNNNLGFSNSPPTNLYFNSLETMYRCK